MTDATALANVAIIRQLEDELSEAVMLLQQARRVIDGDVRTAAVRDHIIGEIDACIASHTAPDTWRRGGAT